MRNTYLIVAILSFAISTIANATHDNADEHATVRLVCETKSFTPGSRAWIGIEFVHEKGWHTYWVNPGDSGLPTKLEWQLPKKFHAGEIAWPAPQRFDVGGLYNFGYDKTVLLPVPIDVPASAQANTVARFSVSAKWLICSHEVCIPGRAALQLDVPITRSKPSVDNNVNALFANARANLPKHAAWHGSAQLIGDRVHIELRGADLPNVDSLDMFPVVGNLLSNAPLHIVRNNDYLAVDARKSDYFEKAPAALQLVLTQRHSTSEQVRAWQVEIPFTVH